MKRLFWKALRALASIPFLILSIAVAEGITSGKVKAQQRPLPQHVAFNVQDRGWFEVIQPARITEYSQPFIYSLWWAQIATCEGLPVHDSAAQHSVQFFRVESKLFTLDAFPQTMLAGTYDDEPSIYVGAPYVWEESTIKHEMLHEILHLAGYEFLNWHPPEFFEKCGVTTYGVVHG